MKVCPAVHVLTGFVCCAAAFKTQHGAAVVVINLIKIEIKYTHYIRERE